MKKIFSILLLCSAIFSMQLFAEGAKELNSVQQEQTIEFTDNFDRQVIIPKDVNSVVSLGPNITEIISYLKPESLVARTDYCDYPASVLDLPSVGTITEPNLETIINLNPDLVLASTHIKKEFLDQLSKAGIANAGIYTTSSIEGSYSLIKDIGLFLNRQEKAEEAISEMKKEIATVQQKVKGLKKPKVYYVVDFGQWGEYTVGGDTFIGQMIDLAGGDNIAKDVKDWNYSLEKLVEADPDIIIISKYYGSKDRFMTTPPYSELRAVKENKLYEIDNNKLDRQGIRNAEGIKDFAEILHPEAFSK